MSRNAQLVVALAVVALLVPGLAQAQSSTTQNANVHAAVQAGLTVTNTGAVAMDFGTITSPTSQATVALNPVSPSTGQTAAPFTVTGAANVTLKTLSAAVTTQPADSAGATMTLTPDIAYGTTSTESSATDATAASTSSATMNGSGALYVWVGGTLTVAAGQAAGTYTGVITLTAAY